MQYCTVYGIFKQKTQNFFCQLVNNKLIEVLLYVRQQNTNKTPTF